jgi:hypothetical protein
MLRKQDDKLRFRAKKKQTSFNEKFNNTADHSDRHLLL